MKVMFGDSNCCRRSSVCLVLRLFVLTFYHRSRGSVEPKAGLSDRDCACELAELLECASPLALWHQAAKCRAVCTLSVAGRSKPKRQDCRSPKPGGSSDARAKV